ncbi:MAG: FAD-dependent oxidoreductase [Roseobacter sp.]|jgi:D-amino-acid dehydrogenase|nr:FAD-dependent oxidoreductase [Roseobacter sp.]
MNRHVLVIGAGIVGVSTAIWLRRAGVQVTLVDRKGPGEGTSHGNAGILASAAVVPVTTPGLLRKAPGYLLNPNVPLFLRWLYLPKLAPWLLQFMRNANDSDTRRISRALTPLIGDSVDQHKALVAEIGLQHWVTESDYCFAYESAAVFDAENYTWALRRDAGFEPELIAGEDVRDYEPNISKRIKLIAAVKEHGFIRDPGGYVRALADAFVQMGGTLRQAEITDFDLSGGRVQGVETTTGRIDCDDAVLASGVWSKPLMQKLGLDVPLDTERGYHVIYEDASGGPVRPTMVASGKFVATPMAQGLRCAGIVEFGGLNPRLSKAPLALLRRKARETFPNLHATAEVEWLGFRPSTTDSLPLIGQIGETRVFAAFGHQHIGLTGGPKTGRLIAGLVTGQPLNTDVAPYAPQRFS